jgi:hypothetical protein
MTERRKSRARHSREAQRTPKKLAYPSPAERWRIIQRREKLLQQLIPLFLEGSGIEPNLGLAQLAQKHGPQETTIVMNAFLRSSTTREFIGEESQLYRIYRWTFARFGGDRRFLDRREYEESVVEHGRISAARQFRSRVRRRPGRRERELYDLTLVGVYFWEDITPLAVPPTPADFGAPAPGNYGYPVRDLLGWGWNLDDERTAQAARNTAKWRPASPDLVRMVFDEGLLSGWPGKARSWAPYHALHMLGYLRAHEHAGKLLALMDRENDWLSDRLPVVWGQMGPEAESPLWDYLDDRGHHPEKRALMLVGLKAIAENHPKRRPKIVEELIYRLQKAPAHDAELNAYIVYLFDQMEAVEASEAIDDAFEQDRVDTSIIQWYDVHMLQEW